MENEEKKIETPVAETAENKPANHKHEGSKHSDRRPQGRGNSARRPVEKLYEEHIVKIRRVCKTTKGGRHLRFSALVVIGDNKGKYGFGLGKAAEVPEAIKKSLENARANMYRLPIVKDDTIPHSVVGKFGATKVFLKPAPAGTGVIAGGPVRAILELAGVKNIYSKVYGSRNPINIIKATVDGLASMKSYTALTKLKNSKED